MQQLLVMRLHYETAWASGETRPDWFRQTRLGGGIMKHDNASNTNVTVTRARKTVMIMMTMMIK